MKQKSIFFALAAMLSCAFSVNAQVTTEEAYIKSESDYYAFTSIEAAIEAAKAGETVVLLRDITASNIITINKAITLDGNGKTLTSTAGRAINVDCEGNVGIKNLTINASGERAINVITKPANVTIENVTATAANYTVNVAASAPNAVVAISNSTLNGLCTVNVAAAGAQVTIDNSTVNCNDNNTTVGEVYAALCLNKAAVGASIVATNTTVNVAAGSDSEKGRNGAENGTVTINGSIEGVTVTVAVITYPGSDYYYGFTSLAAAIEFAKAGDVVTLIRDVEASNIITINKAITLDGNGKTLTSTAGRAINVDCEGNVGIKNLTINASGERAINVITKPANVTIENVTATAANYTVNVAASAPNAVVAISNSTLNGLCTVNVAAAGAQVTIDNSTVNCNDNNTTVGEVYAALCLNKAAVGASIVATNTTVNVAAGSDSEKGRNGAENGTVTINGSIEGVTVTVAVITYPGSDYYYGFTSLAAAIEFAKAGDVVTLIRDITVTESIAIPVGKTVILDLNGKTISQVKEQTAVYQMILNDGTLTINDSSDSKSGKISYTDSGNGGEYISDVIYNRGVLVINGGTIENLSSATVASNGYPHAVDTYSGIRNTSVTINGGTIYCAEYSAIRMFCVSPTYTADLVINGGTIKGAIDMQNGTKDAALGTLTITDGTFETTKNANNIRFANWNGGATTYGISAEIKGGSFNGGITTAYVPAAANWDKGIIIGGTFTSDMTEYCAKGFVCQPNEDGTFGVQEDPSYSAELDIVDGVGDSFVNGSEKTVGTLTYTRTFNNLTWNALYVPFEIPMSELIESYDVAYINDVHSYDDDDDGDIDRMTMEVIKITDEEASLNANYPYLIRPKNDKAKALNLKLTDTKVYVAEENTIDVTSTSLKFDIKGSYSRRKVEDLSGSLVMGLNSTGIASWITMSQGTLNPFRLILTITNRTTTSPVKLSAKATKAIRIHTRGENEETTDIENLNSEQMSNDIYDLQGRRVINPTKGGLYIINGKKVIL